MTNQSPLTGRTALVTGGGTGIGRGIALALAEAGASVAITYRTHAPDAEFVERMRALSGKELVARPLDATSATEVEEATAELVDRLGALDILVNNIGGLVQRSSIAEMQPSLWNRVMAVNLDSMFFFTHYAIPHIAPEHGRIINIASLAGRNGGHAGATAYATTKAAVFGFTRGLSNELAPQGITVNALAPGFIEGTPFHDTFTTPDSKAKTITTIPVGRAGTPEDVAGVAVWLVSDGAAFVTGTVIDVNGGQYFG
jgi:3-oxoacyl-[acyl-carrier protein] reductase